MYFTSTEHMSEQYSLRTEVRLYNSNVKPGLPYGSKCWYVVKVAMNKVIEFHNAPISRRSIYSAEFTLEHRRAQ